MSNVPVHYVGNVVRAVQGVKNVLQDKTTNSSK